MRLHQNHDHFFRTRAHSILRGDSMRPYLGRVHSALEVLVASDDTMRTLHGRRHAKEKPAPELTKLGTDLTLVAQLD